MKELSPNTIGFRRKGDPTIRVNTKSGQINISAGAVNRLRMEPGSKLVFLLDEVQKKVYVADAPDGFEAKRYKAKCLLIQSVSLAAEIIKCTKKTAESVKFLVAVGDKVEGKMCNELIPMR
jgi:hypothetical protein